MWPVCAALSMQNSNQMSGNKVPPLVLTHFKVCVTTLALEDSTEAVVNRTVIFRERLIAMIQ